MKRREFIRGGAAAAAGLALGPKATAARNKVPDYLPILDDKMALGTYQPHYHEREILEPVLLCDDQGRLNPAARGWSRGPLQRCNLSGHWPHKKKWNFWCIISPEFAFSFNPADIDYIGLATAFFIDFETEERLDAMVVTPLGRGVDLPEEVEQSISFAGRNLQFSLIQEPGRKRGEFFCPSMKGREVRADFVIHQPKNHETLNVVIPWTRDRFQFTSKQNTLPVEGSITVGNKKYVMDPDQCHAVLDFGRGMWPYHTYWNWAAGTGMQDGVSLGFNLGAKWTTGTGANENGICYNGRLYKVMEDLVWEYDTNAAMKPWRIRTGVSDMVEVTLSPIFYQHDHLSLGFLSQDGHVAFGRWSGVLKFGGRTVKLDNLMGWAEELSWKW